MPYLDYGVLEINYDRIGPINERVEQAFTLLDYETGARAAIEHWTAPAPVRPFTWTAIGLVEIAAMQSFLDARKGRAVPFWLPSYQCDMTLAEDVAPLDANITVAWSMYTDQLVGTTGARRHIAIWRLGVGAMDYYKITVADAGGEREPEVLTIDPVAVRQYDSAISVVSFLKLCRLAYDHVSIAYPARGIARATIDVRELPMEAPL